MKKNRGFTVIELVVTCVILSIILTFAVPDFMSRIKNWRLKTSARSVMGAIKWTKLFAVRHMIPTCISFNEDGFKCFTERNTPPNFRYDWGSEKLYFEKTWDEFKGDGDPDITRGEDERGFDLPKNSQGDYVILFNTRGFTENLMTPGQIHLVNRNEKRISVRILPSGTVMVE